ncbi:phage tail protein [Pseudomonas putida]|uniref:phage tail protein n=1 Tax=Pseudomonas putida TaxID=303 RepID=UPI003D986647
MPWYKSGTVSVTLNSNAVIGTGTAFLSNGRVGDAFRGPDGGWYEITNIASDTAMSISPIYKGATAAAGAYALAPMQGYVKDSADALRALVNTYGVKLAALGTTGNYDVLPVTKGGTGGDTAAAARASLGLVLQSGPSDATAGRVLPVGAFGWNGGTAISLPNTALVRDLTVPGVYAFGNGGTDLPVAGQAWYIRVCRHGALILLEAFGMTSVNQGQYLTQNYNGTVWSGWIRQALAGANSDITSLSGLTTALSVSQGGTGGTTQATARSGLGLGSAAVAAIVGTVSQSGGVPTGAIIENVVNANGRAIKFADGTMICVSPQLTCPGPTVLLGALYISPSVLTWTYPAAFVGTVPALTGTTANSVQLIVTTLSASLTGAGFAFYHPQSVAGNQTIYGLAVGRWF